MPSEIEQLRAQVEQLSSRVTELERRLQAPPQQTIAANLPPTTSAQAVSTTIGVKLINRIGALTLAIGIVFFFKYAVDNRWIGALGRVILGLLAGLVLIGVADWLRRRNQQVFSQGVAGCGLATMFISIYAAFAFYHLASQTLGFIGLVLTCAGAVILSVVYGAISIAALGFVGAFLTALMLRMPDDKPPLELQFPYLLLVTATAVLITVRQRWTALAPITAGVAVFAALILIDESHPNAFVLFCFMVAALHFGCMSLAGRASGVRDSLYLVGHGAALIGCMRGVALWTLHRTAPVDRGSITSELESFLLAAYGAAILLLALQRKMKRDRVLATVLLGIVVAKLYLWDVWQLKTFYLVSAFVALGVFLLVASFAYSRFRSRPLP